MSEYLIKTLPISKLCPKDQVRFFHNIKSNVTVHGCWNWIGSLRAYGYGNFNVNGNHFAAHRISYTLFVGEIPEGMTLNHICRNRACVNPIHLEVLTNKENVLKGIGPSAIHARKTHCLKGHPYDTENTLVNSLGSRKCRACARNIANKKYQKIKAARLNNVA